MVVNELGYMDDLITDAQKPLPAIEPTPADDIIVRDDIVQLTKPTEAFNFADPQVDPVQLAEKLVQVMYDYAGVGLASNQIGIGLSVLAIRGYPEDMVLFNPKIVHYVPEQVVMEEGCLSFPGLVVKIKRSKEIRVRFQGPHGEFFTKPFTGMTARIVQHEIDHLNGVLFYNRASKFHRDQAFRKRVKALKGTRHD
jgi:peptide deformylase